jgi:hypothetical protein
VGEKWSRILGNPDLQFFPVASGVATDICCPVAIEREML